MPFNAPFQEFEYSYVQRNPDIIRADMDLYYKDPKTNLVWFVPQGFACDGQSIPRPLWPIFGHPLQGTAIRAAFLHDRGYYLGLRSKKETDLAFYHALQEEGDAKPYTKYLGVKLFGFWNWLRHRKNEKRSSNI